MIKVFCDVCGKELQRNAAADRIKRRKANVTVEVLVAFKDQWNAGEVCEPCVISIVANGSGVERVAEGVSSSTVETSDVPLPERGQPNLKQVAIPHS
jgi:hypothetical protein